MNKTFGFILLVVSNIAMADYMTATELAIKCSATKKLFGGITLSYNQTSDINTCSAYIMGFMDNEIRLRMMLSTFGDKKYFGKSAYCLSEITTKKMLTEFAMTYTNYVSKNPKKQSQSASIVLADAINDAYRIDIDNCVKSLVNEEEKKGYK